MSIPPLAARPKNLGLSRNDSGVAGAERLSILLVNYNGMRYLGPCLESIRRFAPPDTEIILEDNASTDGSVEVARREYPEVQIVRSSRNLGFARGNNLAGKNARGRFILLLNTDTLLLEPILPVVNWLECHPSYGALTINMLDGDRISRACTGRFPSAVRLGLLRKMLVPPGSYGPDEAYDVDWVQGSFLLIRADVWRTLNGLDERYFMYAEDLDLCKRICDVGFKCACLPHRQYLHWGGFSPSRIPDQFFGLATYVEHHMTGLQLFLCRTVLLVGCLLRAAFYHAKGALSDREVNRTISKAFWHAFESLIKHQA